MVVVIAPVCLLFLLAVLPQIVCLARNRLDLSDSSAARNARNAERYKWVKMVIFCMFLIYPAVSSRVLSFFVCRTVNGVSYLVGTCVPIMMPDAGAGVVWCGVGWGGVGWCGVVWCGVVWCGVVWCGIDY